MGYLRKNFAKKSDKNKKMLESTENILYSCLDLFPRNVSEIQMKTGLDARILMETLMTLEMEGYIKETAKNYYVRMSDVIRMSDVR